MRAERRWPVPGAGHDGSAAGECMTGGRVAEVPGGWAESCRGDGDEARVSFVRGQNATQRGPRDRTVCGGVFGGRARRPAHARAAPVHTLWH